MNSLWMRQILAVFRLEIRKSFFAKRGLWIYLLASIPLLIWGGHLLQMKFKRDRMLHNISEGATREKMFSIRPGMTKEEVRAVLPHPISVRSRTGRNGVESLTWGFSDGSLAITVAMKDGVVEWVDTQRGLCDLPEDTAVFAGIFQFFYMRLAIFFGCMFVFMNLFRGEMLDRSLHYYFLAPIRRDVLVIGKFLAALVATVLIFGISTGLQWTVFLMHFDSRTAGEYLSQNNGLSHLFSYLGVTALACLGYGSVFLAAGILIRNPLVTAAVVLLWESINGILPAALRKISVIYYLKSLCPVEIPMQRNVPPPIAMLALNVDAATPVVAVLGLVALSVAVVFVATQRIKRMEIHYGSD